MQMDELEKLSEKLAIFMEGTMVSENGQVYQILEAILRVDKIKIELYPNDHGRPHFHVKKSDEIDAVIDLKTLELIKGKISNNDLKKIQAFISEDLRNKGMLEHAWDRYEKSRHK